jgi:hypothetical protein
MCVLYFDLAPKSLPQLLQYHGLRCVERKCCLQKSSSVHLHDVVIKYDENRHALAFPSSVSRRKLHT